MTEYPPVAVENWAWGTAIGVGMLLVIGAYVRGYLTLPSDTEESNSERGFDPRIIEGGHRRANGSE
jgi:hypothetical protein